MLDAAWLLRSSSAAVGSRRRLPCAGAPPGIVGERTAVGSGGGGEVQVHARAKCGQVVAVQLDDASHFSCSASCGRVLLSERPLCVVLRDGVYPCHGEVLTARWQSLGWSHLGLSGAADGGPRVRFSV